MDERHQANLAWRSRALRPPLETSRAETIYNHEVNAKRRRNLFDGRTYRCPGRVQSDLSNFVPFCSCNFARCYSFRRQLQYGRSLPLVQLG